MEARVEAGLPMADYRKRETPISPARALTCFLRNHNIHSHPTDMILPRTFARAVARPLNNVASTSQHRALHASAPARKIIASQPLRAKEATRPLDAAKGYAVIDHECVLASAACIARRLRGGTSCDAWRARADG